MAVSIIIGGGRSSRMGEDKSALEIAGRTLLERTIDALSFSAEIWVVAAPRVLRERPNWPAVHFTLEDPAFGGPAAGLVAGIDALSAHSDSEQVIVFPVDMPHVTSAAEQLAAAIPGGELATSASGGESETSTSGGDGVVLEDESGWPQYLLGRYRLGALRRAAHELGNPRNVSMRKFGKLLNVERKRMQNSALADVDTPQEAKEYGITLNKEKRKDDPAVLARLEKWQKALREELEITDLPFDQDSILDLAAVIAKRVARPGVPVTGYLVGLAVARAIERGEAPETALQQVLQVAGNPEPLLGEEG